MPVCHAKTLTRGTCRYAQLDREITANAQTVLTSANEIDFTRLWQRWQLPSVIKASYGRYVLASVDGIVGLDGVFQESIAILIVHRCVLLVGSGAQGQYVINCIIAAY
jgi:hypothetical protein